MNYNVEHIPHNVKVRILTKNPSSAVIQIGAKLMKKRPLEIVSSLSIHDRYILVDDTCWILGSSLKDAARSKLTTLIQIRSACSKVYEMHETLWQQGHKTLS